MKYLVVILLSSTLFGCISCSSPKHLTITTQTEIMNFTKDKVFFRYSYDKILWVMDSVSPNDQTTIPNFRRQDSCYLELCFESLRGKPVCDTLSIATQQRHPLSFDGNRYLIDFIRR